MCVCVYSSCNATKTNSFFRLQATFSWILIRGFSLLSRVMANFTYSAVKAAQNRSIVPPHVSLNCNSKPYMCVFNNSVLVL